MNILGKCTIYANEFSGKIIYSTNLNKKDVTGKWESMYINVQLPRNTHLLNGTRNSK